MHRALLIAAALFATPALAAPSAEQIAAVEYVAEAIVTGDFCDAWEADKLAAAKYLAGFGVEDIAADAALQEAFNAKYSSVTYAAESLGNDTMCVAAEVLYGPEGGNAPGLMIETP